MAQYRRSVIPSSAKIGAAVLIGRALARVAAVDASPAEAGMVVWRLVLADDGGRSYEIAVHAPRSRSRRRCARGIACACTCARPAADPTCVTRSRSALSLTRHTLQ